MIRGALIQREPQKALEGKAVVDLVFQFGIRGNPEPFLKQQAFIKDQGRISVGAFSAGSHGVVAHQNGLDSRPIDGFFDLFQRLETPVVLQGLFHGQIGEGKRLVKSFKSHDVTPVGFLKEDTLKKALC